MKDLLLLNIYCGAEIIVFVLSLKYSIADNTTNSMADSTSNSMADGTSNSIRKEWL